MADNIRIVSTLTSRPTGPSSSAHGGRVFSVALTDEHDFFIQFSYVSISQKVSLTFLFMPIGFFFFVRLYCY